LLGRDDEVETLNILVVDDEFGMRQGAERVLRNFSLHLPDINGEVHFAVSAGASPNDRVLSGRVWRLTIA
jgi:peroxiredoxin